MKIYSSVTCLTLIVAVLLVGCGGTAATPAVADTAVVPPKEPTSPPPSATQPPPSPTEQPPTATQPLPSPTLPPPTETLPPTTAPETPASSPVPTLANLPVEGVWTGGGTDLLLSFNIQINNGEATISDVGILWEGQSECKLKLPDSDEIFPCERGVYVPCGLNAHLDVFVPVDENGFEMYYKTDDFSASLIGTLASSTRINGVLNLKVEGCGSHQISWQAIPKTSSAP